MADLDLTILTPQQLTILATNIFKKYNNYGEFNNDGNIIRVSNRDIKESINKIRYNNNQFKFVKEHLQIFSKLGNIIESATLSAQTIENKNRENNVIWSYYLNGLEIRNKKYLFEFDVISRNDGENHYRVQRLCEIKKADISAGTIQNE